MVMHRVHDVMTVLGSLQSEGGGRPEKIVISGTQGGGVVAAVAAVMVKDSLAGAVIETGGFRFASLTDQWDPRFVPGAVKYGDVPVLLRLAASLRPMVLGEDGKPSTPEIVADAILKISTAPARAAGSE